MIGFLFTTAMCDFQEITMCTKEQFSSIIDKINTVRMQKFLVKYQKGHKISKLFRFFLFIGI